MAHVFLVIALLLELLPVERKTVAVENVVQGVDPRSQYVFDVQIKGAGQVVVVDL